MAATKTSAGAWIGRALSALVVLAMLADGGTMLLAPEKLHAVMEETGFPARLALPLGAIVIGCAVLYAVPQTALLGAVLLTAFFGGAICAHFRLGEFGAPPQLVCLALALATWGGLYLRDGRIRALLPFVRR
jgi:hypothetical protein